MKHLASAFQALKRRNLLFVPATKTPTMCLPPAGRQTDSAAALPAAHREFAGLFVLTKAFIAKVQKLTSFDCREDRRGGGTGRELAL